MARRGLFILIMSVAQIAGVAALAHGGGSSVNLQLAASPLTVQVGDTVSVVLLATADMPMAAQVVAIDALLEWNPAFLELTDASALPGSLPWQIAGFPAVATNQGIALPFQGIPDNDGDALFQALSTAGQSNAVADEAEVVIVFSFLAHAATASTSVELAAMNGGFSTRVLTFGNVDLTGDLSSAGGIHIVALLGDLNCDGAISVSDIGPFVLALTNPAQYEMQFPNCDLQAADINGDGFVTVSDIGLFVALLVGA